MKYRIVAAVICVLMFSGTGLAGQVIGVAPQASASLGELGLTWSTPAPGQTRAGESWRVLSVVPCSPAHRAGLLPGDILLAVGDREPGDGPPFPEGVVGTEYQIRVRQGSDTTSATLVIGPRRQGTASSILNRDSVPEFEKMCNPA